MYNSRNPVGRALIVLAPVVAIAFLYHFFDSSRWSESEFRDAVQEAAHRLEAEPQTVRGYVGYEDLIEEAVQETGKGPEHALVRVRAIDSGTFEITTDDVDTTYCMLVSPPQPKPDTTRTATAALTVQVRTGAC